MFDVMIVGAGPAGLSAALILGRCRRRVLVCDTGQPRNAAAHALHGFLTRDGTEPGELLRIGREQLRKYETVEVRDIAVVDAVRQDDSFELTLEDGSHVTARKLLLAGGVVDELPPIAGFAEFYGRGVHHCPYCDGWEVRDSPLAVYGPAMHGERLALELTAWSRDIVLCTNGPAHLDDETLLRLARNGIAVREECIARLAGENGEFARIVFMNGEVLPRRALFFYSEERQHTDLPTKLGCDFTKRGVVRTGEYEETTVPGLFVAGDASRRVQLVIVAAAEGAEAAFAINSDLLKEDLK
ncbi:MAG: NAD(P)/FAD-dependent oxidoreductase [Ktedonobacteraceae bacterium]